MKQRELLERITELVDGEISEPDEEKKLLNLIYSDKELLKEYQIQMSVKNFLKKRPGAVNASTRLKQTILNKILG